MTWETEKTVRHPSHLPRSGGHADKPGKKWEMTEQNMAEEATGGRLGVWRLQRAEFNCGSTLGNLKLRAMVPRVLLLSTQV